MTTPRFRLNRICYVSASSGRTEERPIEWRFNHQSGIGASGTATSELPATGKYGFARGFLNLWHFNDVHDSDALLSVPIQAIELGSAVNEDGSPDTLTPDAQTALKDAALVGKSVRFRPERVRPDNYVQWVSSGRADYFADSPKFQQFFFIDVESPELVGAPFEWDRDELVIFTVEGQTAPSPVSEIMDKKVWAQINEYGNTVDIVNVGSTEYQTPATETARAVIRYDDSLARGKKLTDDKNREWDITSSRSIADRRYIEFQLSRVVQG